MSEAPAYLDYNATAPLRPEAARAVTAALAVTGNPSSVHAAGRAARRIVEEAREQVAALAGTDPAEVVFTSGGTEANVLALRGTGARTTVASAVEHDSVLAAAERARTAPVDAEGRVDPAAVAALVEAAPGPVLVSVMAANNETGVIQAVAEVADAAHRAGALVHVDAVQLAGKRPFDRAALGADLMTLSAHKLGGPPGVGALIVRDGVELAPLVRGGGQERRRRAGTENVPGIAGFGAAAEAALGDLGRMEAVAALRDRLEAAVRAHAPDAPIHGAGAARLANTSCIGMPGVAAETQVMALDLAGVAVSAGSACSSGKVTRSHVLEAMGVGEEAAGCAIRASLGWASTEADVDRFLAAWIALYDRTARERAA